MSTPSSDADDAAAPPASDEMDGVNPWVVRLFLILAFGVAFGIEGMTLVRSYLLDGEEPTEQQADATDEPPALGVGDDLLPSTAVSERIARMRMQARSGGAWAFRLTVEVANTGEGEYRLSLQALEADDGTVYEEAPSVTCAPGDSTRLVATWPIGAEARPRALTAVAEWEGAGDSTRTVRRRVSFGHVPVRMQR